MLVGHLLFAFECGMNWYIRDDMFTNGGDRCRNMHIDCCTRKFVGGLYMRWDDRTICVWGFTDVGRNVHNACVLLMARFGLDLGATHGLFLRPLPHCHVSY